MKDDTFALDSLAPTALVAGVDEVGRGCLFGEVVAVAVVMPVHKVHLLTDLGVKDSKKLSPKKREGLVPKIQSLVTDSAMGVVDVATIDKVNILQASLLAMYEAIMTLKSIPELCLVDGNQSIPRLGLPQITMIQGDGRSPLIAAASILAKVWRDQKMVEYSRQYPHYDLENNKGYGTKKHLRAIEEYGITPHHRSSFAPVSRQLKLF
ncbi:ribonuclease HII [Cyanobacterium stanieri LEGE 03274]|uniref:Ribonuclease HII n=1 Tax=Cyanobacterium stanieri LEGE 03274 TaxID=1828756 RepID=A0ABR9V3I7_9CHRO|nr:ribonuclease HII [Cyanobacterium stanieri]MBE9222114.1 ribonuclease HII [Cyanobacterium stanieri LEGE 03274]